MTSCSEYESSDEEEPEPSPCVSDDSDVEMLSDDDAPAAAPPPKAKKRKERSGYSVDDVKRGLKILRAQYMFTHDKDKCDTLHAVARVARSGAEPPDALIKTVCAAFLRSAPRSLRLRPARPLAPPPASLGTRQSIEPTGRGVSAFVCGPSQIGRRWKEMLALESTAEQPDVDAAMDAYIEDASRVAPSKGGTRAGSTETSLSTVSECCAIAARYRDAARWRPSWRLACRDGSRFFRFHMIRVAPRLFFVISPTPNLTITVSCSLDVSRQLTCVAAATAARHRAET